MLLPYLELFAIHCQGTPALSGSACSCEDVLLDVLSLQNE